MEVYRQQPVATVTRGFLNPAAITSSFGVMPGQRVADFGSGHGYFVIELAKLVGESGRVYAVDVQEAALEAVVGRAQDMGFTNVEPIRANLELPGSTDLRDISLDAVLVTNLLHLVRDQETVVGEAARVLKIGGKLIIIDWLTNTRLTPAGNHISPDQANDIAYAAGFEFDRSFDAGLYHWGLIFHKRPHEY